MNWLVRNFIRKHKDEVLAFLIEQYHEDLKDIVLKVAHYLKKRTSKATLQRQIDDAANAMCATIDKVAAG